MEGAYPLSLAATGRLSKRPQTCAAALADPARNSPAAEPCVLSHVHVACSALGRSFEGRLTSPQEVVPQPVSTGFHSTLNRSRLPAATERAASARRGARLQTCRVAIPGDMSFPCGRPQPTRSGDGPGKAGNKTSRSNCWFVPNPPTPNPQFQHFKFLVLLKSST